MTLKAATKIAHWIINVIFHKDLGKCINRVCGRRYKISRLSRYQRALNNAQRDPHTNTYIQTQKMFISRYDGYTHWYLLAFVWMYIWRIVNRHKCAYKFSNKKILFLCVCARGMCIRFFFLFSQADRKQQ